MSHVHLEITLIQRCFVTADDIITTPHPKLCCTILANEYLMGFTVNIKQIHTPGSEQQEQKICTKTDWSTYIATKQGAIQNHIDH